MTFSFALDFVPSSPTSPRTGTITTSRGSVRTPAFMPVGTLATVKSLLPEDVSATGAEILLVNAYHLYLRPGHELIERLGGVHRFMNWPGPILSDSGGFQVFSLSRISTVDDSGVRFRSHIDGSEHHYTPELAIAVQAALGVEIAMPLDHVLPAEAPEPESRAAVERTLRWYERCRAAAAGLPLFPIVQGGVHADLRSWHADQVAALDPPGVAIGGLSVGESKESTWATTAAVTSRLPLARPRYLMGVGSPEDLVHAVGLGVDMFDCVLPTR
ncbi:MAG: tRNA guanosine(34) transglycosylase Tgt, partial [Dehalococcoidia bacterium]